MTQEVGESESRFDEQGSGSQWSALQRNEDKNMTHDELAQIPLESLLYYVLVGGGRRSL